MRFWCGLKVDPQVLLWSLVGPSMELPFDLRVRIICETSAAFVELIGAVCQTYDCHFCGNCIWVRQVRLLHLLGPFVELSMHICVCENCLPMLNVNLLGTCF